MKTINTPFWIGTLLCALLLNVRCQLTHAQEPHEFGQDLLQILPELPEPDPAKLTIDSYLSNTFNNHIELGLSVDPQNSSLAGQDDPQLEGLINTLGVNLRGDLPIGDKVRLKLQYSPQFDNYTGSSGKLNEFDAFTDVTSTELSFRPNASLPEIVAYHQLQRLTRELNVYDNTNRQIGLRFGRLLEYNLRIHRFDDESEGREDFLLIGSTSHKATTRFQFGLHKQILGKVEYAIERGGYQTNLNNLILGEAEFEDGQRRLDWRHIGSVKLLQTAAERIVFQEEVNLFMNRSNVDYFNFVSTEAALSTFYRIDTGRWMRLRFSRVWVQFDSRQLEDEEGLPMEDADNRNDTQLGVSALINWSFTPNVTLNVDYQLIHNRTNITRQVLDFLNYNHNIVSLTLRGQY